MPLILDDAAHRAETTRAGSSSSLDRTEPKSGTAVETSAEKLQHSERTECLFKRNEVKLIGEKI